MKDALKRTLAYLNRLGQAKVYSGEFYTTGHPDHQVVYASIEFIGDFELGPGLEEVINEQINPSGVINVPASIRFIGIKTLEGKMKGKTRYTAEIIPNSKDPKELAVATREFLIRLPRALENILVQRKIDISKVGKEVLRRGRQPYR